MKKSTTELFMNLVQIDSPSGYESKIRICIINWLKKNNFDWKVDRVGNLYAIRGKGGDPILFCCHMDTVEPGRNIKPVIKKGFIKSNGKTILGADNKAYIASLLTALEKIKSEKTIELLFTVKEETGGGIENFPMGWIKSKKAIIFDSAKPLGGIILRSPYIFNFHIALKGKAAHASTPGKGKNVLIPALEIIKKIKLGETDNKQTTINIGFVSGGSGINTIPEYIKISGEVRSYNEKLFTKHLEYIENICYKTAKKYSIKNEFKKDGFCPGYEHKKNNSFIKFIGEIYKKVGLITNFYQFSGISDANILNSRGIQTINLTDGVIDPHTSSETVAIDTLITLKNIISAIIYNND